ncbi:BspA family leucine-rich repeat surface protein [Companilactobacillus nantensis]|uniref:Surface layer protein A domain-containing protein n=1 Tax=Companilactobacillus nantensis DSM 16982 TaxID=1423774 RepID=A0A0R1WQJ1_9LACO|nr:BspA family leucine-rich repeat surface protein [Companilactobacillus nantensis]KRM17347.1 hypothetical protein FD31_GL000235 [Companilactobacillus nantensis DSM 16982]GEO63937.1 hypothetical protein LNA01_11200 [Companilactobacillus nantensis]
MRFNQLKKNPNAIIRKKLYKKGKCWVVASSLAFASGLMLLGASGMSVQADAVGNSVTQGQTVMDSDTSTSNGNESTGTQTPAPAAAKNGTSADDVNQKSVLNTQDKQQPQNVQGNPEPVDNQNLATGNGNGGNTEQPSGMTKPESLTVAEESAAGESQPQQVTGDSEIVQYDPNTGYTDTTNWVKSGTQYNIDDSQIPPEIKKEGIYQQGMDGTSPYFITNAKNLYFLNGTLDAIYTKTMLENSDFMKAHVLNIDTSVATKKVYLPKDSSGLFSEIGSSQMLDSKGHVFFPEYAPKMNLSKVDTSYVTNMNSMFKDDVLPSLDLGSFITKNVTDMSSMFSGTKASELNLSSFDTSLVTNMSYMFSDSDLPIPDLSNFDTHKVTDMSFMFTDVNSSNAYSGLSVPTLDLSSFNTSSVTNMSSMFARAVFSALNLKSFDTSKVTDMSYMFSDAEVPLLDLSSFNTSNVQTMYSIFNGLNSLINNGTYIQSPGVLNVSSFKGDGLTASNAIESMFMNARVKNINMPDFKADSDTVTSANSMFNTIMADTVSIPNFDGSKIQDWGSAFYGAHIKKLDISTWNMLTNSDIGMFYQAIINQITLGPANKFPEYTNLYFKDYSDTDTDADSSDQWVSIGKNGVVDPSTSFYARSGYKDDSGNIHDSGNVHDGIDHSYDGSGKVGVKTFVPMVGIIGKVTLNAPTTVDGKAGEDVVYPDLYGKIGVPITLDVPSKEGYRADKKTITATVTDKGITTDDVINYTKIPTGGGSGTSENIFISDRPQTSDAHRISIYPDQGNVTLYKQEGQKFVPITNREVEAGSDWYFDKVANVGSENSDMKYYRVSTNEWVRANQAYLYQPNKVIIRTNAGAPKQLIHAEGTLATSRMLSPDTDWYSDLIGDLGESQYYRVATNEFVKKSDVTVIKNA